MLSRRRIDGAGFRIGCVRRDSIIATRGGFLSDAGKRAVVHRDVVRVARRAVSIERHDDRAGVNATFDDLGITNKLHRRKLLQAARAQHGVQPDRPRSGSSIGSVEGPAIAVAEDLLADAAAAVAAAAPAVAATWTVNLAWEGPVDLDLAAAVFGERGTFLSLVYYAVWKSKFHGEFESSRRPPRH